MKKKTTNAPTKAQHEAALKRIRRIAGSLKGKSLMKSLMDEKKFEREL